MSLPPWFASPRRPLLIVVMTALVVRVAMFAVFLSQGDAAFLRSNDSALYLTAAANLKTYGVFSEHAGSPPPPSLLHLPGYPVFLLVTQAVTPSPWFTAVVQNVLSLATVAVVFWLLADAWGCRLAFWSALLYGLEPFTAYQANLIMSDTLFTLLLMVGLHGYLRAWRTASAAWFAGSAAVFGLAVYVRSVALYGVGLLTLWWLAVVCRQRTSRRAAVSGLVFALIVGGMLAPWVVRNGRTFGLWKVSTQPNFTLLLYHANHALALRQGISPQAARGRLIAEMEAAADDVRSRDQFMGRKAREILRQEWRSYLPLYVVKIAPFFLQSGWRDVAEAVGFPSRGRPLDLTTALVRRQWGSMAAAFAATDAPSLAHLAGAGVFFILTAMAIVGVARPRRLPKSQRSVVWLLAGMVALFAGLSSPLSHARYRQPVQPLLFALAAVAVFGRPSWSSAAAVTHDGADGAQQDTQIQA